METSYCPSRPTDASETQAGAGCLSLIRPKQPYRDGRSHGAFMSFEGNPASVVASVSFAEVVLSGSKVTVAVFLSKSIAVAVTPDTRSSALRTTMGQVPQVIFSTASVTVCGAAADAVPAPSSRPSAAETLRILPMMLFPLGENERGVPRKGDECGKPNDDDPKNLALPTLQTWVRAGLARGASRGNDIKLPKREADE